MVYLIFVIIVVTLLCINKGNIAPKFILNIMLTIILVFLSVFIVNDILMTDMIFEREVASNNDWISFWGSLLGGLVSGISTLVVIYITVQSNSRLTEQTIIANSNDVEGSLKHSRELFEENLKIQRNFYFDETTRNVHPHFICNRSQRDDVTDKYHFYVANKDDDGIVMRKQFDSIRLSNVGIGTAVHVDLEFVKESHDQFKAISVYDEYDNSFGFTDIYFKPNESKDFVIHIDENNLNVSQKFEVSLKFRDIYMNQWKQKIYLIRNKETRSLWVMHTDPPNIVFRNELMTNID